MKSPHTAVKWNCWSYQPTGSEASSNGAHVRLTLRARLWRPTGVKRHNHCHCVHIISNYVHIISNMCTSLLIEGRIISRS